MRSRWLAFALLALTLTACGADSDGAAAAPGTGDPPATVGDDPTPPDATLGTIALQLASTEPVSADWELVVQIIDPRADSWEERLDLTAMRQLVYLYVLPDAYDVRARVIDTGTGEELMYGEATGVVVIAQETTSVTIALEPSAALQVMVDLDRGGRRFGCEFLDTSPFPEAGAKRLFGAQRLEVDRDGVLRPRYYLWAMHRTVGDQYMLYRSWDAGTFDMSAPAPVTFDAPPPPGDYVRCESAVDVGGRFYALCADDVAGEIIYTSENGRSWQRLARVETPSSVRFSAPLPASEGGFVAYFSDQLGECALLADTQFNLYCGVLDYYIGLGRSGESVARKRRGIFQAWAPDAVSWAGFLESLVPVHDPTVNDAPNIPVAVDLGEDDELLSYRGLPHVFGAVLRGGVYQLWYMAESLAGPSVEPFLPGEARFALVESVDRVNWSQPQPLTFEPELTEAGCTEYGDLSNSYAVFTTPEGVHVYSLSIILWTDPTDPDYFAFRHWWSVD